MSTLHKISGCDDANRRADVVFLHGLGGDAFATWRHGHDESTSWPHWMGDEFPEVGVWSLGYAASPTKRFRFARRLVRGFSRASRDIGQAMSLPDRAGQVLDLMVQRGLGQRSMLLVCHSLGGLLAKQILRKGQESTNERKQAIFGSARAVLFLATPHAGAKLASLAQSFRTIFGTTASMEDLQEHDAHLRDLFDWYRNHSATAGIQTVTYFETRDVLGARIVNETSSHPGVGADPVGLDEDHLSIAKPREPDAQVCGAARDLLRNNVLGSRRAEAVPSDLPTITTEPTRPADIAPPNRIASSKLPAGAAVLIGRDEELGLLDGALTDTGTHVVEFVAWGGVGKSALAVEWMSRLVERDWPGIERYFDWSFYSQGTRDQSAVSADLFIAQALAFFGDADPQAGSPHDRGNRLAELVTREPTLLILDGLEPLQYGSGPLKGQLKDPALLALLKGLAQRPFSGLCVVTTREQLTDLKSFHDKTVSSQTLEHLTESAGAALLHRSGATRRGAADIGADNEELRVTSREVNGHALTLSLLGGYLKLAHGGNIDRRDRVRFEKADQVTQGGHAFRVVAAYERWLEAEVPAERGGDPEQGRRMLAVLRLLGLFDRPASAECLAALRQAPAIDGLTDRLVGLDEEDWNIAVSSLVELGLLSSDGGTLDAHPLVREYFAAQLNPARSASEGTADADDVTEAPSLARRVSVAWTEGHRRLYEHLCETTEPRPDTIDGLQPLYQAVAHGCQAGLHQQACADIYDDRILRGTGGDGFYSSRKLGAIGADLGAVACFFDRPWSRLSPNLSADDQAWLLNEAAYHLRALGRLTEAVEPMRANLRMRVEREEWKHAPSSASNLSELELTLGEVSAALADAGRSVTFADRSGDAFWRTGTRTTHADALHQAGHRDEARRLFDEAEGIQAQRQPTYPRLYGLEGFWYCDLLLCGAECAAWRVVLDVGWPSKDDPIESPEADGHGRPSYEAACEHVTKRAAEWFKWRLPSDSLLTIALDHLTLGRGALFRALLSKSEIPIPESEIETYLNAAVDGLRESGQMDNLPPGLLTQAWHRALTDNAQAAIRDLDEAWEIAERGPMPLHQVDVLLSRARLFGRRKEEGGRRKKGEYPWGSAEEDLREARRLIEKHGYHRRDEELADAEAAILGSG